MFQFKPYPIYVVYSRHGQEYAYDKSRDFSYQNDDKMSLWMKQTGKYLREVTEDSAPAYRFEVAAYENLVKKQLQIIVSNKVGKLLFSLLPANVKIYIVPIVNEDLNECGCVALTTPLNDAKSGGGVRVLFPSDIDENADDILFHELVHAYRSAYNKSDSRQVTEEYTTIEEFLALQMQNVYLSARDSKRVYFSYKGGVFGHPGRWGMKESVYSHLIERAEFIMAFKHLLAHEYLAMRAAHEIKTDFNPFRDFPVLERMFFEQLNRYREPGEKAILQLPLF